MNEFYLFKKKKMNDIFEGNIVGELFQSCKRQFCDDVVIDCCMKK